MAIADDLAGKLAVRVIVHVEKTGDEEIIGILSQTLRDGSQTLQEAFVTSVRVQRTALRADRLLRTRMTAPASREDRTDD